jgi:hypothetical protein
MNLIIDILGALVIGSMLMLMMITFQYQLKDTADAAIFMTGMIDHMQKSTTKLNELISFAGIGMTPTTTITTAGTTRLAFRTKGIIRPIPSAHYPHHQSGACDSTAVANLAGKAGQRCSG